MALTSPWSPQVRRAVDVALCAGVAAIGLGGHVAARTSATVGAAPLTAPIAVVAIAVGAVLWWRRERPVLVVGVLVVLALVGGAIDEQGLFGWQVGVACIVACYSIGSWSEHRRWAAFVLGLLLAVAVAGALAADSALAASVTFAATLVALPAVAGFAVRSHRREVATMRERVAVAERERDDSARLAVVEERARIARELHDVVAHHVSLIGVRAGAARMALGTSVEATASALRGIEESSRSAVIEMRQLLDVLRDGDGDRDAQPGLHRVDELVERWREAGVDVDLRVVGAVDSVPDGPSLSAFRIVEEALSNVAKHSAARSAAVLVAVVDESITVEVTDPGPATLPPPDSVPGGRGLIGMRERAAVFGGELATGRTADGGFSVAGRIPVRR
jgi:signal transduction histidine kinase